MTAAALRRFQDHTFDCLYRRNLLYNTCWEDPAVDHQALELGAEDEVLVITSAGCNALDYALGAPDGAAPRRVIAIDANPRQTAVLDLKCAAIRALEHRDFFALFGFGHHREARDLYRRRLRPLLQTASRRIWDEHIGWFEGKRPGDTFYCHGLAGVVGRGMRGWLKARPRLWRAVNDLIEAKDLTEQQRIWDERVERHLFSPSLRWLLGRQAMMSMLGVPAEQTLHVQGGHGGGIAGFVQDCMRWVFRELPIGNNYFWTLYLRGHYTPANCPRYLSAHGFAALKAGLVERIDARTDTVTGALRADPDLHPSRFVLLDHMDWMGQKFPHLLREEWTEILRSAAAKTRILWRSGAPHTPFVDTCRIEGPNGSQRVGDRLHHHLELAAHLHQRDRVGTYASFHIADVV